MRHGSPPRSRYRIASTIRRSGHLRGRPTWEGGGKKGSSTDHSASVKSLGKVSPARAYCARVVSVHIVDLRKFVAKPLNQRLRQASSRSEEHTSELQSLMRISYAVFCLK